jgi:hypothetical protein
VSYRGAAAVLAEKRGGAWAIGGERTRETEAVLAEKRRGARTQRGFVAQRRRGRRPGAAMRDRRRPTAADHPPGAWPAARLW